MSAETTDRDYWLGVGYSMCSPAAKARASRCPDCHEGSGFHMPGCPNDPDAAEKGGDDAACPFCHVTQGMHLHTCTAVSDE